MMLDQIINHVRTAALVAAMLVLSVAQVNAQAISPDAIIGVWEAENGDVKLEMFDAGGTYAARVIYGRLLVEADGKTFKKDTLNPDPSLRDRSLEGIVFLSDLKWNADDGRWEEGRFYSGATGRTHSARVTPAGETIELRVYMGTPALGRTMVLRRSQ